MSWPLNYARQLQHRVRDTWRQGTVRAPWYDGSGRPTQPNKTNSVSHTGVTHAMKMGAFSPRVTLELNSSGAKIFGQMQVTDGDRVVQTAPRLTQQTRQKHLECQTSTKNGRSTSHVSPKNRHLNLTRPSAVRPRDTVHSSEEVRSNGASHNWLCRRSVFSPTQPTM